MDALPDAEALMTVEEFIEEESPLAADALHDGRGRTLRLLFGTALAALMIAGLAFKLVPQESMSAGSIDAVQDKFEGGNCLCVFDVDRTLTADQKSHCTGNSPGYAENGKAPWDYAYGQGQLVLSQVGLDLDKTFCAQCHIGIVTAGTAGADGATNERGVLFGKLDEASPDGGAGDGSWSRAFKPLHSPLVYSCPDPKKGQCVQSLLDFLNGQQANIPKDEVYFFDDHWGNAPEMLQFGFNGREVSCASRDGTISNGLVGECGARLCEIVREKGLKTCGELQKEGFYNTCK